MISTRALVNDGEPLPMRATHGCCGRAASLKCSKAVTFDDCFEIYSAPRLPFDRRAHGKGLRGYS
eukprot:scaffold167814_cov40-Tisochrysis_lutea.AAC.2